MSLHKAAKIAFVFFALLVAASFFLHMSRPAGVPKAPDYPFEIADSPEERERGLSGSEPLGDDEGLLFVFPQIGEYGFWMKDMRFAIDILWIADDGTIVGIERAVAPETYPETFYPPTPIRYVLEVRAGVAKEKGWDVGERIPLP